MERRLAAILAADVQGYSHLTELNEEGSTATLRMYNYCSKPRIGGRGAMQVDVCFGSKADVRQVQSARPLWVISRHCIKLCGCPLYSQ